MVTIIIVMMKGHYKNTGQEEKQRQTYNSFTAFFTQHVLSRMEPAFLSGAFFIIII